MGQSPKYIEQWERVRRWYERLKDVSGLDMQSVPADRFQDDIFAFFLNCYHMKDWIKNDPEAGELKDYVEAWINKSEALSICADLCNGLKHLSRESSRSGENPKFGPKVHRFAFGEEPPGISVGFLIETDTHCYDAFGLAGVCLQDWETFLSAKGLLSQLLDE
jgi:hypothetical protein